MNRFHVTFDVLVGSTQGELRADRVERFTDHVLNLLVDRSGLIDPDAGAALALGSLEFMAMVEAGTPEDAVSIVGTHLRGCVAIALGADDGTGLRVEFRGATAVESTAVRAAS